METLKNAAFEIMAKESVEAIIVQYKGVPIMIGTPREIFTTAYATLYVRSIDRVCVEIPVIEVEIKE